MVTIDDNGSVAKVVGMTKDEVRGICCRKCGCADLPMYYLRRKSPVKDDSGRVVKTGYNMRVRTCRNCGNRIVTREAEI